jgi:hypothetical protein
MHIKLFLHNSIAKKPLKTFKNIVKKPYSLAGFEYPDLLFLGGCDDHSATLPAHQIQLGCKISSHYIHSTMLLFET